MGSDCGLSFEFSDLILIIYVEIKLVSPVHIAVMSREVSCIGDVIIAISLIISFIV